jgi:hypothetical protein
VDQSSNARISDLRCDSHVPILICRVFLFRTELSLRLRITLMSRPRPLVNLSSAVPTEHQLTPRTPRTASGSRTSQLEEGLANVRLTEVAEGSQDDDPSALQSAPLLPSSSTARFSARERRSSASPKDSKNQFSRSLSVAASVAPLAVGISLGGLLLFMLVLSLTSPGSLHRYLGLKSTSPAPSGHHNSANTNKSLILPLHPIEYLKVCGKMHGGFVHHGDYWDIDHDMGPDMHRVVNESTVCSKTITYMLDGTVGLAADLGLLAQAAALAREVNQILPCFFHTSSHPEKSDILGRRHILEPRKVSRNGVYFSTIFLIVVGL